MSKSARISYAIMAVLLALVGLLHLATLVLTTLFGYFALRQFSFGRSKALGVAIYVIAVAAIAYGLFYFSRLAYKTLPEIAKTTIPAVVNFAEKQKIELPFTDYAGLKTAAIGAVTDKIANVGRYARAAILQIAMLIVGLVVNGYPYIMVIVVITFLFGLLPIIGNVMSNTLIVGVGFTVSPEVALFALIFLVVIHKLEYFLNSKIIGDRIKNPMWLTLLGLVLGEKLMGIPGMILAPVVLHYIKVEASRNKMSDVVREEPQAVKAGHFSSREPVHARRNSTRQKKARADALRHHHL